MATEIAEVVPLKKPALHQKYFCIACKLGGLTIIESIFMDDAVDQSRLEHYNMFKSPNDAAIILDEINNVFKRLGDRK